MSSDPTSSSEIVITGIGVAACLGLDLETIWQRVKRSECGIGPMPALEVPLPPGKDGGQAPELPTDFWPDLPREARYLRWTIDAALSDARFQISKIRSEIKSDIDPSRIAFLLGTTLHGMRAGGEYLRTGDTSRLRNFLAGDTARLATIGLPIGGLSATTCSACSSSLGAIAMAVTLLERGEADLVIAGGYDAVSEYAYAGFASLRLISDPPLRPFAFGRAGMKVAEGYGVVVLERRADADRRGAKIHATIAGWGESADAHHLTRPHPGGEGALAAMRQAVRRAGIEATDLSLIAAHATGTPDNDSSEAAAITTLLGEASRDVPVVGFKSHLGHTLGGAGAVELALSAMAIRDSIVPPTANACAIEYPAISVTHEATEKPVRFTLNTSLGFGGANTCVVLQKTAAFPGTPGDGRGEGLEFRQSIAGQKDPHPSPLPAQRARDQEEAFHAVVTGAGVLVPGAIGNDAFIEFCQSSKRIDRRAIDDAEYESQVINARRLRRMSTYVKLSIAAATIAARDAKLLDHPELLKTAGAILGTTHGSAGYCYDYYAQVVREGLAAANPVLFAEGVPNAAAAQMSLALGLTGACQTILGTRTAGLDALRLAALRIEAGEADRLIVCASEECHLVLDAAYAGCEGSPKSVSLAIAFVLESRAAADSRGATIRATIGRGASVTAIAEESRASLHRRLGAETSDSPIASDPIFFAGDPFSVAPFVDLARQLLDPAGSPTILLRATDGARVTTLLARR